MIEKLAALLKRPNTVREHRPDPDSREPARASGAVVAAGGLVYVLAVRLLDLDPEVALGLATILGPILAAEGARWLAYAPATVSRLLAAARDGAGERR